NLSASSLNGPGGVISLSGNAGVLSPLDTTDYPDNPTPEWLAQNQTPIRAFMRADGTVAGGTINLSSGGGNVDLSNFAVVSASAPASLTSAGGLGGQIILKCTA